MVGWTERIDGDPAVIGGKPKVKGTRIAVELILEILAAGVTEKEIIGNYYPHLTHEDILACLGFASYLVHDTKYYRIPADRLLVVTRLAS